MATLLIRNAHTIATQNDAGDEWHNASILVHDGLIAAIGPSCTRIEALCHSSPA